MRKMFLTSFFARGTAWPSFSIWARLVATVFEQCPGCTARRETSAAPISHAVEDLDVWVHFPEMMVSSDVVLKDCTLSLFNANF